MEVNNMVETVEVEKLTILEKLKYFFTNPNKLFENYNTYPTWLLKFFTIVVITIVATLITKNLTFGPSIDLAIQQTPDLSKEQAEAMVSFMNSPAMTGIAAGVAALTAAFALFVVPLIYWGLASLFGGKTTYSKILAVYALAYIPYAIGSLVTIGFAYYTNNYESLLQPQLTDVLLDRLGIFVIWQLLLLVFGFAKVADLKLYKSAIMVAIMWLLATGISLIPMLMKGIA